MRNRAQVGMDEGDEAVAGSVVYMGHGSFRMEAVFDDGRDVDARFDDHVGADDEDGAPREVTGIVTSPYGRRARPSNDVIDGVEPVDDIDEDATELIARARSGAWRAPQPDALFGSSDAVPVLAAPTGRLTSRRRLVSISRAALVAAGMLVFACGLASGAIARRSASPGAPPAVAREELARPTISAAVSAIVAPEAAPAVGDDVPLIEVPEPVVIHARKKAAAAPAAPARWVDPFAD